MENRKCQVNLAGIGMGSKGTLTEEVRKIIAESDVLIGATRMLEGFREKKKCCYAEYLPEKIRAILDEQEEKTRCSRSCLMERGMLRTINSRETWS